MERRGRIEPACERLGSGGADGCGHEGRGEPGRRGRRHRLERAEPSRPGPAAHPGPRRGRDGAARLHPERIRPPAPGWPQPLPRAGRARRDQPVLHRGRARRRGLRPGRGLRRDLVQLRRGRRQGAQVPARARGAAGARHPHHPGPRPGTRAAPDPRAGHSRGAARPAGFGRPVLGRRRRPPRRGDRGQPPARARAPPHRPGQRAGRDPPVRRPAPRRPPGGGAGRAGSRRRSHRGHRAGHERAGRGGGGRRTARPRAETDRGVRHQRHARPGAAAAAGPGRGGGARGPGRGRLRRHRIRRRRRGPADLGAPAQVPARPGRRRASARRGRPARPARAPPHRVQARTSRAGQQRRAPGSPAASGAAFAGPR